MMPAAAWVAEWVAKNFGPFLGSLWGLMRRMKWFSVGVVLVSITFFEYLISFFAWAGYTFASQTAIMAGTVKGFMSSANPGQTWATLSAGAALMNCVVPLDYMLACGAIVIVVWFNVSTILAILRLLRLALLRG